MKPPGHPRYPNPNPQVQAAIEHNRRVGEVTVWRNPAWETTTILLNVGNPGSTSTGSRSVELLTGQGAFLATGAAVVHYGEHLVGCRLRFLWAQGEVRRFVTWRPPLVVEYQPPTPKPRGVGWGEWHVLCRGRREGPIGHSPAPTLL